LIDTNSTSTEIRIFMFCMLGALMAFHDIVNSKKYIKLRFVERDLQSISHTPILHHGLLHTIWVDVKPVRLFCSGTISYSALAFSREVLD